MCKATIRLCALVLGLGLQLGCASVVTKARIPDAKLPGPAKQRTVSFAPIFEGRLNSNSVYAGKEPGLMRRVLLSPNLVFESSRSSVDEPKTVGPAKPTQGTPWLPDALGEPVEIQLSSMLMNYLSAPPRSSLLLAPALTKKWDPAFWCIGTKDCLEATWVERLILMQLKAPTREGKEPAGADGKAEDLPTCAFAVRRLGSAQMTLPVVASYNSNNELEFRPRRSESEPSVCEQLSLTFPVVQFQAELVSLKDGRLLARIDETRSPQLSGETRRQIFATQWVPSTAVAYEQFSEEYSGAKPQPVEESKYTYVERYTEQNIECRNAVAAYGLIVEELRRKFEAFTLSTATELFRATIDPLYSGQPSLAPPPPPAPTLSPPPEPPPSTPPPAPVVAPPRPPEPAPGACTINADCKKGRVCKNGACVAR